MDASQFPRHIDKIAKRVAKYARDEFPGMAVKTALRFIDGNFRAQGFQGKRFQKWEPNRRGGTILIQRGHLRRSFQTETRPGMFRVYSYSKYGKAHNRGFKGTVTVKAHSRRKYTARRVGTGRYTKNGNERKKTIHEVSGQTSVKQHVRQMNIPKRQFMPESAQDSPVLNNAIKRNIIKSLKSIMK